MGRCCRRLPASATPMEIEVAVRRTGMRLRLCLIALVIFTVLGALLDVGAVQQHARSCMWLGVALAALYYLVGYVAAARRARIAVAVFAVTLGMSLVLSAMLGVFMLFAGAAAVQHRATSAHVQPVYRRRHHAVPAAMGQAHSEYRTLRVVAVAADDEHHHAASTVRVLTTEMVGAHAVDMHDSLRERLAAGGGRRHHAHTATAAATAAVSARKHAFALDVASLVYGIAVLLLKLRAFVLAARLFGVLSRQRVAVAAAAAAKQASADATPGAT
eukprot:CAMPEP_0198333316 /NCGR_PEP_ID=MMETSP1450-20131203/18879_1 /TAXON_ID=753684 ORGANISM="Madagascaria erythrocladiodes, Strain CCMP3234" /NCGR_SAMPLE_ID=MMETSP1450 /ASSEMBLY_ACC=CAM_ASM_001115 /LENGTH=272 /DNA_ID=CAMNT_0044037825 /DNA_START=90 /DNA_END=904 /DNA_ORIENTATION=+